MCAPLCVDQRAMAFVNLVDQDLGMSLVLAAATLNGWPLPHHDPALDADVNDEKDDAPVSDPNKPKTKKRLEKERIEMEKRKAEREQRLKDIEAKRKAEAAVQAEIKKNAVYVKLIALAEAKDWEALLPAVLASSPRMSQLSEAGASHALRHCRCATTTASAFAGQRETLCHAFAYHYDLVCCGCGCVNVNVFGGTEFDLIFSLAQSLWVSAKNHAAYIAKYTATLTTIRKYPVTTLKL